VLKIPNSSSVWNSLSSNFSSWNQRMMRTAVSAARAVWGPTTGRKRWGWTHHEFGCLARFVIGFSLSPTRVKNSSLSLIWRNCASVGIEGVGFPRTCGGMVIAEDAPEMFICLKGAEPWTGTQILPVLFRQRRNSCGKYGLTWINLGLKSSCSGLNLPRRAVLSHRSSTTR
jgi:hypothetical protein